MSRPAEVLLARLRRRLMGGPDSLFVGIDGRSGVGKSTLAAAIAEGLADVGDGGVTVIEGDDFYGGGSAEVWDRRTEAEKVDRVIDWRRQRGVLEQLRACGVTEWRRFDWDAPDWDSDNLPLASLPVVARIAPLVVLEGVYSCRPELHDLLDLRVLVDAPREVRRRQILEREGDTYRADWEARWSAAEGHYFSAVMPPERFDLAVGT